MESMCSITGCSKPVAVVSRGWCAMHYQRWRNNGDPLVVRRVGRKPLPQKKLCLVDGCNNPVHGHGYCWPHYRRWKLRGSTEALHDWSIISPGTRFGRLTVVELLPDHANRVYRCKCDCGKEITRRGAFLRKRASRTQSCGCLSRERAKDLNRSHGMSNVPEYSVWCSMRRRCLSKKDSGYADWGGRGITIDPRWNDFVQFYADMGPRPSSQHVLDRRDNDGPYSPKNCWWALPAESWQNKRPHGTSIRSRMGRMRAERDALRNVAQLLVDGQTRKAKALARELLRANP